MIIKPKIPKIYLWGSLFALFFTIGILTSIFYKQIGEILNLNDAQVYWVWSMGQDLSELSSVFCIRSLFILIIYLQEKNQLLLEYIKYIKPLWYVATFALDLCIVTTIDNAKNIYAPFTFSLPKFINLYIATFFLLYRVFGLHKYTIKGLKYLKKNINRFWNFIRNKFTKKR